MSLAPGSRLGSFEVLAFIGAGGMGEVYRGRDTTLGREVAIKVLPEAFARHPERLARFEREARVLASLNHPGIASIHRIEEADGVRFLVLELVSGETLAQRLARGPLPTPEALELCRQVAEALDAAHGQGIVHRDLKPSNVKVTSEGRVKVLDFGLAKAFGVEASPDPDESPTASHLSSDGAILGTAAYMSPEQARGKAVDRRADVWSFGCVLFETLTGRRAFPGPTVSDTLVTVLEREPDWSLLPQDTPPLVRALLRRCLQKDKNRRLPDIGEARIQLEDALGGAAAAAPEPPSTATTPPPPRLRRDLLWLAAGVLVAGAAAFALRAPVPASRWFPKRLSLELPAPVPEQWSNPVVALSADGRKLAFVVSSAGRQQIYLKAMERIDAAPVPGTEGGAAPFFAPDGEWLGFWADGRLKKVALKGGEVVTLCEAPGLRGASWGEGNMILFAPEYASGLRKVPADGGTPQPVTTPDAGRNELSHRWPVFLPGGRAALFASMTGSLRDEERSIAVVTLGDGKVRTLVQGATFPRWSATGHLLYARAGALLAVPFDPVRLEATGPEVTLLEDLRMETKGTGVAHVDVSAGGPLVYVPGHPGPPDRSLVWVDRNGRTELLTETRRPYQYPRLSPDGRRLVVRVDGSNDEIWVYEIERDTWTRLTFEGDNQDPVWSADGTRVAFSSNRGGQFNLFWTPADGSGKAEALTHGRNWQRVRSFSPDGRFLAYDELDPRTAGDIFLLPLTGERKPEAFVATPLQECCARFSPDGRFVAYVSAESGREEVYVRLFPGSGRVGNWAAQGRAGWAAQGRKWPISRDGGIEPVWRRDGKELFYRSGRRLMVVPVTLAPDFTPGAPQVLSEAPFEWGFDVAPDGRRFVMVTGPQQGPSLRLVLVPDWSDEITARMRATR